jgi:serine/threonine-protein kinase RsbW
MGFRVPKTGVMMFQAPRPTPAGWTQRTFRRTEEVVPLLDAVASQLRAAGFPDREVFGVRLALEEAMVNAVRHGHRDDASKTATLRYSVAPDCFLAEVEDEGKGFDPAAVPDPLAPENLERPGGRGLLLIRRYMSWVRHNAAGNCVTLCRLRTD